jgi:prepilin-type N-terminal cleavage/methylation domain-containing protein
MKLRGFSISLVNSSRSRANRRGFTLIELLVVIGIILVLIGIFFAGGKAVMNQAKERDTHTRLEAYKTMFENYRNATHLTRPPPAGRGGAMVISTFNAPTSLAQFWTQGQEIAPGTVSTDANFYNLSNPTNYTTLPESQIQALINTALVMYAMKSVPENATILNNIPAGKTLSVTIGVKTPVGVSSTVTVPLLLDGWGNPILFVPGGGLVNVWVDSSATVPYLITSAGVITPTSSPVPLANYNPANPTYFPPGSINPGQPFFVSAGPDGDFSNAHGWTSGAANSSQTDDNIYSFK